MKKSINRRQALEQLGTLVVAAPTAGLLTSCGSEDGGSGGTASGGTAGSAGGTAGAGGGAAGGGGAGAGGSAGAPSGLCVLSPEQTEGPFYFDPSTNKRDITDGRPGVALGLKLTIVDVNDGCAPVPDAVVDVWQADGEGQYSGYPGQGDSGTVDTTGESFLRGTQTTDADGQVEFTTIYPGWYPGRTPHIHFKVRFPNQTLVTSQLYFDDAISAAIFTGAPYNSRTTTVVTNSSDAIFDQTPRKESLIAETVENGDGYLATLTIGVQR